MAAKRSLVLGSRSPRRVRLLGEIGVAFDQIIPEIEEERAEGESPYPFAQRLAEDKARWVAALANGSQVVIGCDTIVVLEGAVLGKPTDKSDALATLSRLSGRPHVVCTGVALAVDGTVACSGYSCTDVFFNAVTTEQLATYIETGEPMDKAGAYGIQGMGAFLVDRIEGDLDTVIGLPRNLLDTLAGQVMERL